MVINALTLHSHLLTIKHMLQVRCVAKLLLNCCTLPYAEMWRNWLQAAPCRASFKHLSWCTAQWELIHQAKLSACRQLLACHKTKKVVTSTHLMMLTHQAWGVILHVSQCELTAWHNCNATKCAAQIVMQKFVLCHNPVILHFSPTPFKKYDVKLKSCVLWHCHWVSSSKHSKGMWYLYLQGKAVEECWEHLAINTASQPSKTESSAALLWHPQISHNVHILWNYNLLSCNGLPLDLYTELYESILHLYKMLHSNSEWAIVSAFCLWRYPEGSHRAAVYCN